jgi:hypothetical protein
MNMSFLDRIPYALLIFGALFMSLAPFSPEPHLVQKFNMLMAGDLHRPVDLFDVAWHLLPAILLVLKYRRAQMSEEAD